MTPFHTMPQSVEALPPLPHGVLYNIKNFIWK